MMNHRLGVILAGALAAAACGGDSISIDELPGELEAALCGRLARCNAFVSVEACRDSVRLQVDAIAHSIEEGRVTYDGEAAASCIDSFAGQTCDSTSASVRVTPAACDRAIRGAVADGGTCYSSQECVSSECDVPDCGMACCAGTCQPTIADAAIGQSCATASCVTGAFCSAADVCTALLSAGGTCQSDNECGYGLTCNAADTCVASANRGEACVDDGCQDIGDRCDGGSCVAKSAVGGACQMGFAGLFDCQQPLVCNGASLKCEAAPTAGQACQFFCGGGAFCNDSNVCEAPRANGGACNSNSECATNFCDDNASPSVCAEVPTCG